MSLTPTYPPTFSPAYKPIILTLTSDVRNDGSTGSSKTITAVNNENGFAELNFSAPHLLLKGDFVLITAAPGATYLLGVAKVISVSSSTQVVINTAFITGLSSNGTVYKYLSNYTAIINTYIYVESAPTTPQLVSQNTVIPRKNLTSGFLYFEIDVSAIIKSYNYEGLNADDVLSSDLYPLDSNPVAQLNNKSFVKFHNSFAEAYDNPVGGEAEYQPQHPTT
jgi:hypothetical protein